MAKMVKHQKTRGENITPNNDIEDQSRVTNMCDNETLPQIMCDGEVSTKEYTMVKHQ